MNEEVFVTESADETQKIAEKISKELKAGEVLALFGDLGAGKTTFVQGLARGLGIKQRIISPTFIIVRSYEIKIKDQKSKIKSTIQNSKFFYHVDLYRVEPEMDIKNLGIEEILRDENNIVAVEWAEKIQDMLPDKRFNIFFTNLGGDKRKITIWKR